MAYRKAPIAALAELRYGRQNLAGAGGRKTPRKACLVPRPLAVFDLGQSVSDDVVRSSRIRHREGLGESRTGTRQE